MAKADVKVDDNLKLGDLGQSVMKIAGGVGVVGLAGGIGLGAAAGDNFERFFHSYLVALFYVITIGAGALWFVTLQFLTNSEWSVVVRRIGEVFAANVPLLFVLSLGIVVPVAMGSHALYDWTDHAKVHANHLLDHKKGYLNVTFFMIRVVVYFGIWFFWSNTFLKKSVAQDSSGDAKVTGWLQGFAAPGMILFALTLTFCGIDFIMSLNATWFSTMFGVYLFAGAVPSFYSLLGLTVMWLQKNDRLQKSVTIHHRHDIGKMMFAFTVFWAYIAFSQFMLIWYADIPEETHWYHYRFDHGWGTMAMALLLGRFVIPFLGLLSRHVKRHKTGLGFWAIWILVIHYVDLYWLIMPEYRHDGTGFGGKDIAMDILLVIGTSGLFIASSAFTAGKFNLMPTKDPRLGKSLAFENY